jgi:hypothetical protein
MLLLSTQQDGLLKNNIQHRGEVLAESRRQESHVHASILGLREILARDGAEAVNCQEVLAGDMAGGVSEIQTQLAIILARQNYILSSQSIQVAKAEAEANDANVLARLIRLELEQQLEPLLDRIDGAAEHIDRVVTTLSLEAATKGPFQVPKHMLNPKSAEDIQIEKPSLKIPPNEVVLDAACSTYPSKEVQPTRLRQISFLLPLAIYPLELGCSRLG